MSGYAAATLGGLVNLSGTNLFSARHGRTVR